MIYFYRCFGPDRGSVVYVEQECWACWHRRLEPFALALVDTFFSRMALICSPVKLGQTVLPVRASTMVANRGSACKRLLPGISRTGLGRSLVRFTSVTILVFFIQCKINSHRIILLHNETKKKSHRNLQGDEDFLPRSIFCKLNANVLGSSTLRK